MPELLYARVSVLTALVVTFFWAVPAIAQPRIGLLYSAAAGTEDRVASFRTGMRENGRVEGRDFSIEARFAESDLNRFRTLALELVNAKVQVIVTSGPAATRAASEVAGALPIVMTQDNDPVANGFVKSFAKPGGTITGMSSLAAQIVGKQIDLLKEVVPNLLRLALIGTSSEPANIPSLQVARVAAASSKISLIEIDALKPTDYDTAFRVASEQRADAVLMIPSGVTVAAQKRIIQLASVHRMPVMYFNSLWVSAGGLTVR